MRPFIIVPLSCAVAGMVLSFLLIFAGNKPGFMEEYQIVTLNTSTLGHDLLPKMPKTNSPIPISTPFDELYSSASGITDQVDGILNNVIDDLSRSLGIQQWYGWHLRNFCEGMYKPNATSPSATFDVTDCSKPTAVYHFKIADIIDKQLQVGPLHIGLDKLKWPDSIQKKFDELSTALHAALAFYAISVVAAGISIFTGLVLLFGSDSLLLSLVNMACLFLSFFSLFIASIIITVVNSKSLKTVNENGNKIGLYAYKGHKYLALTWSSMAVMLLAVLSFAALMLTRKRRGGKMGPIKS
ncbi:putative sur7 protein [Golovinomyces cichoracearum]|uniref:Putative sur7 protein n=1 Tax=Golovinomyces cichoracearum TaxID=62708 RepID=A0A420J9E4_9PEZI|nr:putative sur7 protein [Golovinomyces cichoracearum]